MNAKVAAYVLRANQPRDRFYQGGSRISAFRGDAPAPERTPEDWVGSVTEVFGEARVGLTALADGTWLRDAIASEPAAWLGESHVARYGDDAGILVKLLDAGERLPVHAHPDVPFARAHLSLAHGKTEAWVFLNDATVFLGFSRDVAESELATWVREQDTSAMLGAMHELHVRAGDAVWVPAGTPHAIGEGAFLVEVQEPTDLSILLEWDGFAIDGASHGHLGLGFPVALAAISRGGLGADEVRALRTADARTRGALLPDAARFFRAERWGSGDLLEAGYSVIVCTSGEGRLASATGEGVDVRRGATVVTPYASGSWTVSGDERLELIRCRPPAPDRA